MGRQDVQEKLRALRNTYAEQLPGKISQIYEGCRELLGRELDESALKALLQLAHTLKGSSSSFGFPAVGAAAGSLETALKSLVGATGLADAERVSEIAELLEGLKAAHGEPPDNAAVMASAPALAAGADSTLADLTDKKIVFVVEDDVLLMRNLAFQIGHFGYDVRGFTELSEVASEIGRTIPAAIIMDLIFPEGGLAGADAVRSMLKDMDDPPPVIYVSSRSDFDARLGSVRSGGSAYFVKPVNISRLIDKLDALTTKHVEEPYRILVVDDDIELAAYYALILQEAGMTTRVVNEPVKALSHISGFNPDLILMDMYMPDCNGLELAKVIRQMVAYVSVPIVFLSAETDTDKQLKAMSMGGDDFLTKPIHREHLVSSVGIRAERMRIIRSFMDSDSLTGLLNHTKTKEQLDIAVERSKRQNSSFAFAMIDIDRFKSVNDTYGHPAGDMVILSLSRLLQQRLRKTDIVGRYGGEEFAVILNDTDADHAFRVLDEIRASFAQITHQSGDREFSVSFSCGIATYPACTHPAAISNEADKALYSAKDRGRNNIVMADRPA